MKNANLGWPEQSDDLSGNDFDATVRRNIWGMIVALVSIKVVCDRLPALASVSEVLTRDSRIPFTNAIS